MEVCVYGGSLVKYDKQLADEVVYNYRDAVTLFWMGTDPKPGEKVQILHRGEMTVQLWEVFVFDNDMLGPVFIIWTDTLRTTYDFVPCKPERDDDGHIFTRYVRRESHKS